MDSSDRAWLRANRHRIKIGQTEQGQPLFDFDDHEVFDATDDFLTEDCDEILGERFIRDSQGSWQIIFVDPRITIPQLEEVIARI